MEIKDLFCGDFDIDAKTLRVIVDGMVFAFSARLDPRNERDNIEIMAVIIDDPEHISSGIAFEVYLTLPVIGEETAALFKECDSEYIFGSLTVYRKKVIVSFVDNMESFRDEFPGWELISSLATSGTSEVSFIEAVDICTRWYRTCLSVI